MAMRLYTKDEFEAELKNIWELTPTDHHTNTNRMWKTKSGKYIAVPMLNTGERYPDYYMDYIVKELKRIELM